MDVDKDDVQLYPVRGMKLYFSRMGQHCPDYSNLFVFTVQYIEKRSVGHNCLLDQSCH